MKYKILFVLLWLTVTSQRESLAESEAEVDAPSWQMVQIYGGLYRLAYCREMEVDADRLRCYDEFASVVPVDTEKLKGGELKPVIIKKVKPRYPAKAKASKTSGKVFVTALVGKDGDIKQIGKITGPKVFHEAAEIAALGTEFMPAMKTVPVWVLLPFTFTLKAE